MKLSVLLWCLVWYLTPPECLASAAYASFKPAQPKLVKPSMSEQSEHEETLLSVVEIPLLTGLPVEKAIAVISEAGLKTTPVTTTESGRQPGTVIKQSPEPGAIVKPGSPVELVIAGQIVLTGLSLTETSEMIEQSAQEPEKENESDSDPLSIDSPDSIVVSRKPETGRSIEKKSSGVLQLKTIPKSPMSASPPPDLPTSVPLTTIITITVFTTMIVSIYLTLKQIIKQRSLSDSNSRLSGHDDIQARANHRKHLKKSGN
jgi:hypothetical protein